jgi:hypothetical protein
MLFRRGADFPLARRLQSGQAVAIGELFTFLSGLYFRGKAGYSAHFASVPKSTPLAGAWVITTDRGLVPVDTRVTLADVESFARQDVDPENPAYHLPVEATARTLAEQLPSDTDFVLLGSIATGKYVDVLSRVFGPRLLFPELFVGRGDMSRGGLMLRAVDANKELAYVPVMGTTRRGARPPKLTRRTHDPATEAANRTDGRARRR